MTDKITKALETVNELHGETLKKLDDNIQTVQTDYAEAMEMLWRQSQTIKRLYDEIEKLRAALKPFLIEHRPEHNVYGYKMVFVTPDDLRAAAAALKETDG